MVILTCKFIFWVHIEHGKDQMILKMTGMMKRRMGKKGKI